MATSISPQQLAEIHHSGQAVDLLDVRTPAEFREVHVPFAKNVPLGPLDARQIAAARNGRVNEPLYVICLSGARGAKACEKLLAAGMNAVNIEGGTLAWAAADLPGIRGKKSISLKRQVRIAAGSLVMFGCVLGYYVHPLGYALSAFVGADAVESTRGIRQLRLLLLSHSLDSNGADFIFGGLNEPVTMRTRYGVHPTGRGLERRKELTREYPVADRGG
jgi:rhodanese-related sulfurtransferase